MRPGLFLCILALAYSTAVNASTSCAINSASDGIGLRVSPTRYDYSVVAGQITEGTSSKYEQAEAIYRWICQNISYDTSYSIRTADGCWDSRSGVCQAYCELFYRLAEPLGLKTYIITGDAKNPDDESDAGHSWIFAVTSGENTGILIDPTWGAGSVSGGIFKRSDNDMTWFHVDPRWMIFTHFPDDEMFQLLDDPLTRAQYDSLPMVMPLWGEYGFDAGNILDYYLSRTAYSRSGTADDAPTVMEPACGDVLIRQMPLQRTLRIGRTYNFSLGRLTDCRIAIINGDLYTDWDYSGNLCEMAFTPSVPGDLVLSIRKPDGKYWGFVKYEVAEPDAEDLRMLQQTRPLAMPEITSLPNASGSAELMMTIGIDGRELLSLARSGDVTSLPVFYSSDVVYKVAGIPLNGTLEAGKEYTFTIKPESPAKWAIIDGGKWHYDWQTAPVAGTISMTIVPQGTGPLVIAANTGNSRDYSYCIEYKVE